MEYSRKIKNEIKNDCTIRALSVSANISYNVAKKFILSNTDFSIKNGAKYNSIVKAMDKVSMCSIDAPFSVTESTNYVYEKEYNIDIKQPTINQFIRSDGYVGSWFILVGGHALAIVDGEVKDWVNNLKKIKRRIEYAARIR